MIHFSVDFTFLENLSLHRACTIVNALGYASAVYLNPLLLGVKHQVNYLLLTLDTAGFIKQDFTGVRNI